MYLTDAERLKTEEIAASTGIAGNAEELVRQAMAAILQGEADDVAYSVTEAAGIHWLTPDIWFKEKLKVDVETARALLAQGKKDGTFEAPIPEDDTKAISEANDLVEMAQTAWDQHVRGPEVEVLLRMAVNGSEPQETPKEEPKQEKAPPPAPEPEEPKAEEPAPEPEQPQEPQGGDLSSIEPWESYDGEKVSDIIAGINAGKSEYSPNDFVDLMANVWAYEAAHKARQTILNHLQAIADRMQSGEPEPEEQQQDEKTPPEDLVDESQGDPQGPEGEPSQGTPESAPEPSGDGSSEHAESQEGTDGEQRPVEEPKAEEKPKRELKKKEETPPKDEQPRDLDYEQIVRKVEEDMERERVHKPKAPEEDIPDLPWDWTKMTDKELQSFHGIYSAVAYYKGYQLSREERMALHCKAAADELHNALLVALDKYDDHGKEKKVALIEAEVESDENIIKWRRRQRKHEQFAASHRNERDSVGKLVDALSRTESMRHQEWERTTKLGRQK